MEERPLNPERRGRRPPLCAASPLLWSLLPMITGILAAYSGNAGLVCGGLAASFACCLFPGRVRRFTVILSYLGGLLLMHLHGNPVNGDWLVLPPREVVLQMEVSDLFNARKPGHIAGIGQVRSADLPRDNIINQPVAFYLDNVSMNGLQPGIGQFLECRGVLTFLPAMEKHNDYHLYLLHRDIYLSLGQGEVLRTVSPPPALEGIRLKALDKGKQVLTYGGTGNDHPGRVLASMVLGDRSPLSDERIQLYKRSGTFHLFAVSGLHIGSFALCLHLLARLLRIPGAWRIFPVLGGTWAYVWLTGASPSSVRAGIMISCVTLSRNLLRQPHLFPAITVSAWLVLLLDPRQILDLGFQLSYGVVASIILIGLPMAQYFRNRLNDRMARVYPIKPWHAFLKRSLQGISDLSCVSVSAGMASMPLIVQHFSLFTPGGVIFGILLNPLASLTVMLGCLSMLGGICFGVLPAGWLAMAAWPGIHLVEKLLGICLSMPGAVADGNWSWPPVGTLLLVAVLLLAWWLQWLRQSGRQVPAACLFLPLCIVIAGLSRISINA